MTPNYLWVTDPFKWRGKKGSGVVNIHKLCGRNYWLGQLEYVCVCSIQALPPWTFSTLLFTKAHQRLPVLLRTTCKLIHTSFTPHSHFPEDYMPTHLHFYSCENPRNRLLFQNEIKARKVDAVITVVDNKKYIFV